MIRLPNILSSQLSLFIKINIIHLLETVYVLIQVSTFLVFLVSHLDLMLMNVMEII